MTIKYEIFKSFVSKQIHVCRLICKNYIKDLCSRLKICIKNKIKKPKNIKQNKTNKPPKTTTTKFPILNKITKKKKIKIKSNKT